MAVKPLPRTTLQSLFRLSSTTSSHRRAFSTVIDESFAPVSPPLGSAAPRPSSAIENAVAAREARTRWSKEEISEIYNSPLMELAFKAVRLA